MERNENIETRTIDDNNTQFNIKIQTLDNIFPLPVPKESTVNDLKNKLSERMNIPNNKQRLIFQGKLLQNQEKLKTYKITEGSVIHLVAKTLEDNHNNANNNNTTTETNNNDSNSRVNIDEIFNSIIEVPLFRTTRRRGRRRISQFDLSESFESMYQNIITVQGLINCRNKYDDSFHQNKTIVPYDLGKSKYEVGQWVDVKDTIDQWLEAQVIQVRNNQAYVHYNGWGTRWDEWIDFNSPRIATFKTYTVQSPGMFLSPYPSLPPDANIEPLHRSIDSFYYLDKAVSGMQEVSRFIDHMSKLRKKNIIRINDMNRENTEERKKTEEEFDYKVGHENQPNRQNNYTHPSNINLTSHDYEILHLTSQIIPIMDRVGRLLSDCSLHLSHLLLNPSIYPQLLLGYNQTNDISDTLSCTSGYSMFTNEGSTLSGFNNAFRDHNVINNLQNNVMGRNYNMNTTTNQTINSYNHSSNHPHVFTTNPSTFSTGGIHSNNPHTTSFNNVGTSTSSNILNQTSSNMPNLINNTNTNTNTNTNPNTGLGSSISELPFFNRYNHNQNNLQNESYPKINLQIPAMLNTTDNVPGNYGGLMDSNVDIYVHAIVPSTRPVTTVPNNVTATTTATTDIPSERDNNTTTNPIVFTPNNNNLNNTSSSITNTIPGLGTTNNNTRTTNTNTINTNPSSTVNLNNINNTNTTTNNNDRNINSMLENLMNMISSQSNRTRGSVNSENSSTSHNINTNINTTNLINNLSNQRHHNHSLSVATQRSSSTVANMKDQEIQTDLPIIKDNLSENESHSIKSFDKNNLKKKLGNKSHKSNKSMSDISEFEQYNEGEESDFVIRTNNDKIEENDEDSVEKSYKSNSQKNDFEEKDEENK